MRRVFSSLLSTKRLSSDISWRGFFSAVSSHEHERGYNRTRGLLFFLSPMGHVLADPRRHLCTLVNSCAQVPRRPEMGREKSELEEAFESARTLEEMVNLFADMETVFDEDELGLATLKIGLKLDQDGENPEKALSFGLRSLEALQKGDAESLPVIMALQLMGSSCYRLKRFQDGLGYLNRANRMLGRLGGSMSDEIRPVLHAVQLELANVKTAMGRREDAIGNLKTCLELKKMTFDENSNELGNGNRDLAEAMVSLLNFKEALPYCLKALEIHRNNLGSNSVEVAHDQRLLGVIYTGMEDHEKALEQNEMSRKVLKSWGLSSDLLRAEIDAANMNIAMGKYDEAIETLKGVVQKTEKESEERALILLAMGKALCHQEKREDSKRCLGISSAILKSKEMGSPEQVSETYMEISMVYETMNELDTAVSLLKRALSMLEKLPQQQHLEGNVSARIGWLLLLTGKVSEGVPYLESAAERLKESFGSNHFGVGYIYNNLGAAYMELGRPQSAAQMFTMAKEIMDVSLGPCHADSIEACQNISKAYGAMENHVIAIKYQQLAVDAWESHGASGRDELEEAQDVLKQLKEKVYSHRSSSSSKHPSAFTENIQIQEDKKIEV